MPSPIINRLKKIEYQISKRYDIGSMSDGQLVYLAQSVINAILDLENEDQVIDTQMPTELFSVTLDWSAGEVNDAIVELSKGSFTITQDNTLENVEIPGYTTTYEEMYTQAVIVTELINGISSGEPEITYTEIDVETTLTDASVIASDIIG